MVVKTEHGLSTTGAASISDASATPRDPLVVSLRLSALTLAGVAVALLSLPVEDLAWTFLRRQDAPVVFALALFQFWLAVARPARPLWRVPAIPRAHWVAAAIAVAVTLTGSWLVFGGFANSRDEILAEFDADLFRSGHLAAMVPAAWQPFKVALNPMFMLPVKGDAAWVTTYLPGNAGLRALVGLVLPAQATSALLAGLAVLSLHGIARRLWPDAARLPLLADALLLTSGQFIVMAMTPYAMTAHLALNLAWLWLWLRRDRMGDAGALAVGWLATGLHQLVFHPLFVAPFLLVMWRAGERRRAAFYVAGYLAIALFWVAWRPILFHLAGIETTTGREPVSYVAGAVRLLGAANVLNIYPVLANLLRFFAWQSPLLLPLLLLSVAAVRRGEGIARPLAAGIGLMLAAMLLLMPGQGHGWGYRYFHGLIGSTILLAVYGWRTVSADARAKAALGLSLVAGVALVGVHATQAWAFVRPWRQAYAAIQAAPVDIVFADGRRMLYTGDFVRNAPDLSNRPLVMEIAEIDDAHLGQLCRRYRTAMFDVSVGDRYAIPRDPAGYSYGPKAEAARARRYLAKIGCAPRL